MGRRSEMKQLVAWTPASEQARERTKVMLLTLAGQWTVQDGCARLGISRTRFQDLRRRMLTAAVSVFEHGQPGRPRQHKGRMPDCMQELKRRVRALLLENRKLRAQLELEQHGLGDKIRARLARGGV
jgi:hypothetical protein